MRPTTAGAALIAAASSARPGQTTLPLTSPRSGSSADPSSAALSASTSDPPRAQARTDGRVLEPHRPLRGGSRGLTSAGWLVLQLGDVLVPLLGCESSGCRADPLDGVLDV